MFRGLPRGRGGKPPVHFYCVLHATKGGEGVQIACTIAYVINGRSLMFCEIRSVCGLAS